MNVNTATFYTKPSSLSSTLYIVLCIHANQKRLNNEIASKKKQHTLVILYLDALHTDHMTSGAECVKTVWSTDIKVKHDLIIRTIELVFWLLFFHFKTEINMFTQIRPEACHRTPSFSLQESSLSE